jgi:phosphoribosylaminoimidazole carboxylase PurK protein
MTKRIGIIGGGQLGRMMTIDAKRLGFAVIVIDPTPDCPAKQVGAEQILADYNDEKAIKELAQRCDYLTFEIELANASLLEALAQKGLHINPSAQTLTMIKDKLEQKKFLRKAGIPIADFVAVVSKEDIMNAAEQFGYPIILKARFDAYDGRGNALITKADEIDKALEKLQGRALYVEKFVPFIKELAVIAARSINGDIATYQVVETVQKNNICHTVTAPADINKKTYQQAEKFALSVMEHLKGAGVFGIEMFLTDVGVQNIEPLLFVNEIAPRVHNTGHYTIEACHTSQFEQHIRAITGLPLGDTTMKIPAAAMINILGERNGEATIVGLDESLKIQKVNVHLYGKKLTKIERKMGHITVLGETVKEAYNRAIKARESITI